MPGRILIALCTACVLVAQSEEPDIATVEPAVDYDVVFLANGQRLMGELDNLVQADDGSISLTTKDGGRFRLQRGQVASIRPSIDRRLHDLSGHERAGLLELSRYCLIEERRADALTCLKQANAKQPLDLNHLRLMARLTDEIEGPEPALPIYRRCRELGAEDAATIARLDELEASYKEWEAAKAAALEELGKMPEVKEGMEANANWKAEDPQWYNPCRISFETHEVGPRKNKLLQVDFDAGEKYKAALALRSTFQVGSANRFAFWVLNNGIDNLGFSLAVKTGTTNEYFESKPFRVEASGRWQEVSFDLKAENYKSAATEWQHKTGIQNLDAVKEIQIQIQNQKRNGAIMLDGIGFKGGGPGKL